MQNDRRSRRGSARTPQGQATSDSNGGGGESEQTTLTGLADFDQAVAEIDAIIARLEDGQLSLDEEMRLYERGMRLAHACDQLLQHADLRVEQLRAELGADSPAFTLEDFETDDDE